MNSSLTTAAVETSVPIGRLISVDGFSVSRGSTSLTQPQAQPGSTIQSYVPLRTSWEPSDYLESESYCGLPYVPEAQVPAAVREVGLAIRHAERGLAPAPRQQLLSLIGTLRLSKNAARMQGADAKGRIAAMLEEIADLPADVVRDAIMQIRMSGDERDDWFPTGGRIRAAAAPEMARRRLRLMRLREWERDLERRAKAQEEARRPLTAEERAELEMLNARRKNAGYVPDPSSPPPGIDQATWAAMLAKARRHPVSKS